MATVTPAIGIHPRSAASAVAEPLKLIQHPSPNFGPRRDAVRPDLIVLHYTAMTSAAAALARLCDPSVEVSAHYLISETGKIWQLVAEDMRAWHAGAGGWGGVTDVNSHSIGIELANSGQQPFAEPQIAALEALMAGIMARWQISPERVIGHSDLAPDRKSDPGRRFDWQRLARQGLSVWFNDSDETGELGEQGETGERVESGEAKATRALGWRAYAKNFGIVIDAIDPNTCADAEAAAFEAFRARFLPWKSGAPDTEDLRIIQNLARRFPVDRARSKA